MTLRYSFRRPLSVPSCCLPTGNEDDLRHQWRGTRACGFTWKAAGYRTYLVRESHGAEEPKRGTSRTTTARKSDVILILSHTPRVSVVMPSSPSLCRTPGGTGRPPYY